MSIEWIIGFLIWLGTFIEYLDARKDKDKKTAIIIIFLAFILWPVFIGMEIKNFMDKRP